MQLVTTDTSLGNQIKVLGELARTETESVETGLVSGMLQNWEAYTGS